MVKHSWLDEVRIKSFSPGKTCYLTFYGSEASGIMDCPAFPWNGLGIHIYVCILQCESHNPLWYSLEAFTFDNVRENPSTLESK